MTSARHALGRRAEQVVADYLYARGFGLLMRNVRLGALEIDIVARQGSLVAIVEVRTRGPGAFERPFASVAGKKRMHLLHAADRLWNGTISKMTGVERVRIDVAAVTFDGPRVLVEYVEGAIVG